MKNIKYISASAGSGKTYRLTEELTKAIKSGAVQPENVILTTFTKAAASEFKEKAKAMLYEKGMVLEADRLDQALIGTIHSVAESLILKYWYVLGLSPKINPIAEEDLEFFKNQSLVTLVSYSDLSFLNDFAEEFSIKQFMSSKIDYDFWKRDLFKILEYAANYDIQDFSASEEFSKKYIKNFLDGEHHINVDKNTLMDLLVEAEKLNEADASDIQDELRVSIKNQKRELAKNNGSSLRHARNVKTLLGNFKWKEIGKMKNEFLAGLDRLYATEEVHSLLERYIELMFKLAAEWIDGYKKYKTENHLIDFTDMENYFYELLGNKEVADEIKATYKYVFVDEFQDCSPKQVKIFDRLSEIVENSIWVGDKKQAIYGFRGSDTELTTAVMNIIEGNQKNGIDGCTTDVLENSWRSLPAIVNFTNKVFIKAFNKTTPEEEKEVRLTSKRKGKGSVNFWWLPDSKKENRIQAMSANIVDMINNGEEPSDIAVLARTNYDLSEIAASLRKYNVPVFIDEGDLSESNTVCLVTSLLELIADETAELPKAQIAFLTEPDYKLGKILDDKIEFECTAPKGSVFYDSIPLVKKLLEERETYKVQSVSSMVESLIIELDLYNVVKKLNDTTDTTKLLHAVIDAAVEYEGHCELMHLPSSIMGFISYIKQKNISVTGSAHGVQLFTYHRSKGLEWKTVILWGCDNNFLKANSIIKNNLLGVNLIKKAPSSKNKLYPPVIISVLPNVFSGNTSVVSEWSDYITQTKDYENLIKKATEETKRLMYVAMTRPRDNLIIALCGRRGSPLPLTTFENLGFEIKNDFLNGSCDLLGVGIVSEKLPNADLNIKYTKKSEQNTIINLKGKSSKDPQPRELQPSSMGKGDISAQLIECSSPITVIQNENYDSAAIGTCIHDIFCVADYKTDDEVKAMIAACGFAGNLPNAQEIKKAWESLKAWLTDKYGAAQNQYHELPFKHQLKTEQIVTGSMDFVWETATGCVIVDYKTFPGSKDQLLDPAGKHYAGNYKGQLECYEKALIAAGKKVLAKLLYYPVVGVVVKI